jgi:hypothetical protein
MLDRDSPDWKGSTHRDNCIVRAPDETAARRVAGDRFRIAVERSPDGTIGSNPWSQDTLVSCETYPGTEYPDDGDTEVLFPSETNPTSK